MCQLNQRQMATDATPVTPPLLPMPLDQQPRSLRSGSVRLPSPASSHLSRRKSSPQASDADAVVVQATSNFNPKPKPGFKRMRTELQVHEGVDMFKEKLTAGDTKEKNGKTLRANAVPVVSFASEYVPPAEKKKPQGRRPGRPKKEPCGDDTDPPPKHKRGRPKKTESQDEKPKHYYILIINEFQNKAFAVALCDAPEPLKAALKQSKLLVNNIFNGLCENMSAEDILSTKQYIDEVMNGEEVLNNDKPQMIYRVIRIN